MCTQNESNPVDPIQEEINPRCIVKFRPADNWKGEYGFDWFREGDYEEYFFDNSKGNTVDLEDRHGNLVVQNLKSKSHYKDDNLIGKYFTRMNDGFDYQFVNGRTQDPDNPDSTSRRFLNSLTIGNATSVFYEQFRDSYSTITITPDKKYVVPIISLFYKNEEKEEKGIWGKHEAKNVKLLIDGNNIDTDISNLTLEFECTEGVEPVESIEGRSISKNVITHFYETHIDIALTEKISNHNNNGLIKVYAKTLADRFLAGEMIVEKCNPKYVHILFVPIPVKITSQVSIVRKNLKQQQENIRRFFSQAQIVPIFHTLNYQNDNRIKNKDIDKILKKYKHLRKENGCVVEIELNASILGPLSFLFNEKYKEYNNWYKVFFFGIPGENRVLGTSSLLHPSWKSAAIFPCFFDSVISHELTHCFGLWHSFSNNSPYTFEKYKTSNIMDYPLKPGLDLISYWKWQWDIMRGAAGVEDIESENYCV